MHPKTLSEKQHVNVGKKANEHITNERSFKAKSTGSITDVIDL